MWNVTFPWGADETLFEIEKLRRPMLTVVAAAALDARATQAQATRTSVASVAARRRRCTEGVTGQLVRWIQRV
jgi:hypothetical protein